MPLPGDFGIKPGGGVAMRLVRWGTKSRYGHAAEVVATGEERVQIVEAAPGGVRMQWVRPGDFRWSTGGPLDHLLTDEIRARLVARAWSTLNSDYDWPSVLEFIPRFWFANFKGYFSEHPDEHLFCSELVVWNRREEGLIMFPSIAPGAVSPGMLEKWCP